MIAAPTLINLLLLIGQTEALGLYRPRGDLVFASVPRVYYARCWTATMREVKRQLSRRASSTVCVLPRRGDCTARERPKNVLKFLRGGVMSPQ